MVELVGVKLGGFFTYFMEGVFDMADAFCKAFGGIAAGGFGVYSTVAGEVDEGKEDIAEFSGEGGTVAFGLGEFFKFFAKFGGDTFFGVGPIEAHAGGAALEVLGAEKGGEAAGNTVEATFTSRFLLLFELVPAVEDLGRGDDLFFSKNVGVAADEFLGESFGDGLEVEGAAFVGELGMK